MYNTEIIKSAEWIKRLIAIFLCDKYVTSKSHLLL